MIRENIVYYLLCDACKKSFVPATDRRDVLNDYFLSKALMLALAADAGWHHELMLNGNVTFYCPQCYKKLQQEEATHD